MVKLTKIYTRVGDGGTTMLGTGEMVEKFSPRVTAYGEVDEANAALGLAVVAIRASDHADRDTLAEELTRIQNDLFDVGADLCVPIEEGEKPGGRLRITEAKVTEIENAIDRWNARLAPLNSFILPGGSPASAAIHLARTVVRRAERAAAELLTIEPATTNRQAQVYLNRVSDYLFVVGRIANDDGAKDVLWQPGGGKRTVMSATVTSDFKHEFEAESTRRLRKRFLWYCGVALGFGLLGQAVLIVMQIFASEDVKRDGLILSSISALSMIPYIWAFVYALRRRSIKRALLVRIVFWLLVMAGLANIGLAPVNKSFSEGFSEGVNQSIRAKLAENQAERDAAALADGATQEEVEALPDIFDDEPVSQVDPASAEDDQAATQAEPSIAEDDGEIVIATTGLENGGNVRVTVNDRNVGIGSLFMFNLFFAHFFAAMFIPWTPREAIAPLIPLVIANAIAMIIFKLTTSADSWTTIITAIALSPLVGVPGTLICWWRHSRYRQKFHYKMLRGRYGEIKQELSDAQRIHEALFPKAIGDGLVRMDYVYEPMRQIGGDYFFTRSTDREDGTHVFDLVLIDVTGHGLTAALTVNRLAGELQREFGENPETSPAQILTGLNNYVHHTLALHSVYATALALRIDTRKNRVEWASAGHPPAFLRGVDGRIDRLDSTALVLGACLGDDFVVDEESHTFGPGDTVVVYTDGATEARNAEGKMLSVRGLEAIIANDRPDEHGGWSATVMRHVEAHRHGPAEDDTLLVEVYRPVSI